MNEVWRNIEGYENYQVSNLGNVRSLNYNKTKKKQVLKPEKNKNGYLYVVLCKDGKPKLFTVHRLVLQAFVPNPNNLPVCNHKDECKINNFVYVNLDGTIDTEKSNLEWSTKEYNEAYGTRNQRLSDKQTNNPKLSKSVLQYTLEGMFLAEYPSVMEIQRRLGYDNGHISSCCLGKRKTAYGFIWKYAA